MTTYEATLSRLEKPAKVVGGLVAVEIVASVVALVLSVAYAVGRHPHLWMDYTGLMAGWFLKYPTAFFAVDAPFNILVLVEGFLDVSPLIVAVSYLTGIVGVWKTASLFETDTEVR